MSEDADDQGRLVPMSGVSRVVTGGRSGLPPLHQLTVDMDDGSVFEVAHRPPAGAVRETARFLIAIQARHFGVCPICGSSSDLTKEHVPQRRIGGQAMTSTCRPCNNGLGSRVEADLTDWHDGAMGRASLTAEGVNGRRHAGRALLRWTTDGRFALIPDRIDEEIVEILRAGGQLTMNWVEDLAACRIAALKHAYLAGCLQLGEIPETASADRIRRDLILARDTPREAALPVSVEAVGLRLGRTFEAPQGPSVALHADSDSDPDGEAPRFLISLAGTVLVSWPFDDVGPLLADDLRMENHGLESSIPAPRTTVRAVAGLRLPA